MTLYEFRGPDGEIRIREIETELSTLKFNQRMIAKVPTIGFLTRNKLEGLMYYDNFLQRIIVATEK